MEDYLESISLWNVFVGLSSFQLRWKNPLRMEAAPFPGLGFRTGEKGERELTVSVHHRLLPDGGCNVTGCLKLLLP